MIVKINIIDVATRLAEDQLKQLGLNDPNDYEYIQQFSNYYDYFLDMLEPDQEQETLYSREEIEPMLTEVMNLGMTLRQNQLSLHDTRSGNKVLEDWKKQNLK